MPECNGIVSFKSLNETAFSLLQISKAAHQVIKSYWNWPNIQLSMHSKTEKIFF